jgi:DNA-binding transcriptional regulator YiaG
MMLGMAIKRKAAWSIKLKRHREDRKLTQEQAAKKLGVPLSTLRNWEQSRTKPLDLALDRIHQVYDS